MLQQSFSIEQVVRATQIITGAMVTGVVTFAAIVVFVLGALKDPSNGLIMSGIGAAFAGVAFVLHLVIPPLIAAKQGRGADKQQLYGVFQMKMIIGLALLEGAAFFNLVACLVEHNWWSLAVAGGLCFWMLAMFPTRTKIEHWAEAQQMSLGGP